MYLRPRVAIGKGAVAVLSVISEETEKDFAENGYNFEPDSFDRIALDLYNANDIRR